ncbi:hypothetical protein [Sigmofec virus UA08Rod_5092]|uniref:Uncharacterized protein n=1 Tax=Sigmofec virus UA08Rod_5092 TaxID=2929415 RepID=A0A976N1S6_9VIRU|nr:hypothetical protein [Sigmofec virus UA08Rod_5092]
MFSAVTLIDLICLLVCAAHVLVSVISALVQRKQIKRICDKCGVAVTDDTHDCTLSDVQMNALVEFIKSIKEIK